MVQEIFEIDLFYIVQALLQKGGFLIALTV